MPNNKILGLIKLTAFEEEKTNSACLTRSVFDWVLNTVGMGDNVGNADSQHFLLFPQWFE